MNDEPASHEPDTNPTNPSLLLSLRALLPSLSEQRQKVAQYILDHPADVVHLSIGSLAQRASTSEATVFSLCRLLGVDGYQNLKIRLAQDLAIDRAPLYAQVTSGDSLAEAVRKAVSADMKALSDTLYVTDLMSLDRAAEALLTARRVDIYGSGGGAIAAMELQYKLVRVGVRAVPHVDAEMQIVSATLLSPGDLAIAISHSGRSPDVLHALRIAKTAGAASIAITNHPSSPIAKAADIRLTTAAQDALAHGYPLGARVAQMSLIGMLYTCLARKREDEAERNQKSIARALYGRQG
jgi:RpiR family carbohydrate utilization transcriptional regulator